MRIEPRPRHVLQPLQARFLQISEEVGIVDMVERVEIAPAHRDGCGKQRTRYGWLRLRIWRRLHRSGCRRRGGGSALAALRRFGLLLVGHSGGTLIKCREQQEHLSAKDAKDAKVELERFCFSSRSLRSCGQRLYARFFLRCAFAGGASSMRARNCPVYECGVAATSSGVPVAMMRPPPAPPSGPRSTIQSAVLITSRLCSITTTVLPWSTSRCSTRSSCSMSWKCRPVVGSSRM